MGILTRKMEVPVGYRNCHRAQPMQAVRGSIDLRARLPTQPMQGVRGEDRSVGMTANAAAAGNACNFRRLWELALSGLGFCWRCYHQAYCSSMEVFAWAALSGGPGGGICRIGPNVDPAHGIWQCTCQCWYQRPGMTSSICHRGVCGTRS